MTRLAVVLTHAFWAGSLAILPLAFDPFSAILGLSTEATLLAPRGMVLLLIIVVGVLALMVGNDGETLGSVPRLILRMPTPLKLLLLLILWTFVAQSLSFGVNAIVLFGSGARYDGLLVQAGWLLLAFLGFSLARTGLVGSEWVVRYLTVAGVAVAIYGSLQVLGIEPLQVLAPGVQGADVAESPLGHRALTATFIAIAMACLYVNALLKTGSPIIVGVVLALLAFGLVATGGRSGFVAFIAVWLAATSFLVRTRLAGVRALALSACLIAGGLLAAVATTDGTRQVETLAAAASGNDSSFTMRSEYYWPVALKAIAANPVLGGGYDSFKVQFWRFATPEQERAVIMAHDGGRYETVQPLDSFLFLGTKPDGEEELSSLHVDRAHNYYLDMAVSYGVPSALLLLAAIVSALSVIIQSRARSALAMASGVAVYLIVGLAWFPSIQLDPTVWTLFGASLGVAVNESHHVKPDASSAAVSNGLSSDGLGLS